MPSDYTACATLLAQLCHRTGTVMPSLWHSCANRMAQHPTRYLIPVNAVGKSDPSTGTFAEDTDLIHAVTLRYKKIAPAISIARIAGASFI